MKPINNDDRSRLLRLIENMERIMPSDSLDDAELDAAHNIFFTKKITIGFDGLSVTIPNEPALFDNILSALRQFYDEFYTA